MQSQNKFDSVERRRQGNSEILSCAKNSRFSWCEMSWGRNGICVVINLLLSFEEWGKNYMRKDQSSFLSSTTCHIVIPLHSLLSIRQNNKTLSA
jgi:hypothetical protein